MSDRSSQPYRHPRRGIAVPFLIVGLLFAAWTGWWFYLTRQIETRLDAQVAAMRHDGWTIDHAGTSMTGWPFRARLAIPHVNVVAPSGHGVAAPEIVAEANAWNPDHWVVIAPDGLTLTRPDKGKVAIAGDGLRLSASHLTERFPDLRVEMIRPTFTTLPGAEEFPIVSAERIQFYSRPHLTGGLPTTDEMDVKFVLDDARGRPGGPVEGMTRQGRLSADLEATIQYASRLQGANASGVFANWARAGGRFVAVRGELSAGESRTELSSDQLQAGADGRLQGRLALKAEKPMAAIAGLARSGSGSVDRLGAAGAAAATAGRREVSLTLLFRDGRTWLGPFALTPAPKLF